MKEGDGKRAKVEHCSKHLPPRLRILLSGDRPLDQHLLSGRQSSWVTGDAVSGQQDADAPPARLQFSRKSSDALAVEWLLPVLALGEDEVGCRRS